MSSDDQSETRARIEGEIAALEANIRTLEESTKPVAPEKTALNASSRR